MSNQMYVQFQRVINFNVEGESVSDYWCVKIEDDNSNHSFFYEKFKDIIEDWKEEQVIESLKTFEILGDFIESLEYQKVFTILLDLM
ncbi:hypothetical protein ABEI56_16530 [Peribacillus castrilensis]|uniref:hypothetical protein n=1 Tax=Peribacillus TaxID=2675229 RepID=UPI003870F5A4